jgi:hypothetical protein
MNFETISKDEIEAGFINRELVDYEDHINELIDSDPNNVELSAARLELAKLQED